MPAPMDEHSLVTHCASAACPVLFLDTCSLLDLIRLPERVRSEQKLDSELQGALTSFRSASTTPPGVVVVLVPPVPREFAKHVDRVEDRVLAFVEDHRRTGNLLRSAQHALLRPRTAVASMSKQAATVRALAKLATDIVDISVHLDEVPTAMAAGVQRAWRNDAPSRRGKEHNDCVITEHVLAVAGRCQPGKQVFLSSNVNDYGGPTTPSLRQPLDVEFPNVGVDFRATWVATRFTLGL